MFDFFMHTNSRLGHQSIFIVVSALSRQTIKNRMQQSSEMQRQVHAQRYSPRGKKEKGQIRHYTAHSHCLARAGLAATFLFKRTLPKLTRKTYI